MEKYTRAQRELFLEQRERSGKSITAFCREKGISSNTFNYWLKHKRKSEQQQDFIEIPATLQKTFKISEAIVISSGQIRVSIPSNTAMNEVEAMLAMVWKMSC